jgi:DNA-binding transcriptional LysR family regulator
MPSRRTQLQYLTAIAEEGQITRAARRLDLAQPTLSQSIAQLEAELGVALLERHSRGVTLTPAGEAFLSGARTALAAETDAAQTGRALARAARGAMILGFCGSPPPTSAPELLEPFAAAQPHAQIEFQDLPFPSGSTSGWLADVDVAFCHSPAPDAGVAMQPVMRVPRALVAPAGHPLAKCERVSVADLSEATFIGYHPDVQPEWAHFYLLADANPAGFVRTTEDHVATSLQMLAVMAATHAVAVVPQRDAEIVCRALTNVVARPLEDAEPALMSLAWRRANRNPLVTALATAAAELWERDGV